MAQPLTAPSEPTCKHLRKGACLLCGEAYCKNCDADHLPACREAHRP